MQQTQIMLPVLLLNFTNLAFLLVIILILFSSIIFREVDLVIN
jgi:hypothetical protein